MKTISRTIVPAGWAAGPAQWLLSPAGAIYHPVHQAAVIADMHLGYELTRGQAGDTLPAFETAREIRSLATFLKSIPVKKLVIAGDLVESARNAPLASSLVSQLHQWLTSQAIEPVFIAGNHDPSRHHMFTNSYIIDHWHITHGHETEDHAEKNQHISGHWHPVVQLESRAYKTFLVSEHRIILPAFSHNAAGVNFLSERQSLFLEGQGLRAWLCSPGQVLDFGYLAQLSQKIS